jgi:hypothetical protein
MCRSRSRKAWHPLFLTLPYLFRFRGDATEPAHCFEAQALVLGNRLSGEWPGRDPGVTIYLAGEISRSGEVAIHMHSKRAD